MKSTVDVLYFICILTVCVFIVVFILYLGSKDLSGPAIDIFSTTTNLYWAIRVKNDKPVLASDGQKNDFFATWNLEVDTSGTGAITFRNAYSGGYIYFTPDKNGAADQVTVDLTVRQPANIDPVGWFNIQSTTGGLLFQSVQSTDNYLRTMQTSGTQYAFVTVSPLDSNCVFKLIG